VGVDVGTAVRLDLDVGWVWVGVGVDTDTVFKQQARPHSTYPLSSPPPPTMATQQTSDSKSPHRKTSTKVFFEKSVFDVFLTSTPPHIGHPTDLRFEVSASKYL
jgi:hypothetical protein